MTTPPVPPRDSGLLAIVSAKETPEGWQLVPVEMTPAMLAAAVHATNTSNDWLAMKRRWNAALEAAPAPPVAIAHEAVDLLREILVEIDDGPGENSLEPDYVKRIRALVNATPTASDRPVVRAEIDELVNRFLAWPLPKSVCSDLCATNSSYAYPRSGTNLLNVDEARAMLEYVLADRAAPPSGDDRG